MANKIIEKVLEPSRIEIGSSFKLKIKAIRYATYNELKEKKYNDIKSFKYRDLKGV